MFAPAYRLWILNYPPQARSAIQNRNSFQGAAMLGKKSKSIVGLDIGSSALKAVELKPARGGFELVHIAHQNLQSDTIVDGHIIDLNHVSDSINRFWSDQNIKTNQVATSLSGHAVIVKKILLQIGRASCRERV